MLAAVALAGGVLALGTVQSTTSPRVSEPRLVRTLGDAVGNCGEGRDSTSVKAVVCSKDPRGLRRGSGYFMKTPN